MTKRLLLHAGLISTLHALISAHIARALPCGSNAASSTDPTRSRQLTSLFSHFEHCHTKETFNVQANTQIRIRACLQADRRSRDKRNRKPRDWLRFACASMTEERIQSELQSQADVGCDGFALRKLGHLPTCLSKNVELPSCG